MQRVAASVAYDRCGKAGKILMQQAEYENKNSCRIGERVLQKEKRPFYIVDKDGGVAMCTENSLEYIKQEKRLRISAVKSVCYNIKSSDRPYRIRIQKI